MTAPDNSHVPTIAEQHDNRYGVHCLACSDLAQDYVWPCREGWTSGVPAVLVAADALAAASEELADTQQASQDAVRGLAETVEDMRRERDAAREELAEARREAAHLKRERGEALLWSPWNAHDVLFEQWAEKRAAAVPGDGEQDARMVALHAAYDAVGMTHTGPTHTALPTSGQA